MLFNLALEKVIWDIGVNHEMDLNGKNVLLWDTEIDVVKETEYLLVSTV